MTQATDFDAKIADAISALDETITALENAKAIKNEIGSAAIGSGLNNPDGSATPQKQAAMDFENAVTYRVNSIDTVIAHVQDARRLLVP